MREGAFRFGGLISLDNLRQQYYRDEITQFLCYTLVQEAIGKGFIITDKEGNELDWNAQFQKYIEDNRYLDELVRGLAMERRDGKVLLAFLKNDSKLIFRSFTRKYYDVKYDDFGEIEKVKAESDIEGRSVNVPHSFEGDELKTIREIIFRRREKVNEGMSYLEPIWDKLIALYFLYSHLAYRIAREGAGIKAVEIEGNESQPVDPVDDDAIDDLIEDLANLGSANDILVLPPGVKFLKELMTATGFNWREALDILLVAISILTGVPKSRLEGLVPGQQQGAEVNEESYFDVLRDIQEQVTPVIKWFVRQITVFYGFGSEEFEIDFNVREEMSEVDQIELDMKRVEYAKALIDAGMDKVKAFKRAGLEINKSDLEEPEPIPTQLQQFNGQNGQNEDNGAVLQSPTDNNREIAVEND